MCGVLCSESTVTDKYEFMCTHLGVSKSGFYERRSRPESATAERREKLKVLVEKAFDESEETYGYRRVHTQLRQWGVARSGALPTETMALQPHGSWCRRVCPRP